MDKKSVPKKREQLIDLIVEIPSLDAIRYEECYLVGWITTPAEFFVGFSEWKNKMVFSVLQS